MIAIGIALLAPAVAMAATEGCSPTHPPTCPHTLTLTPPQATTWRQAAPPPAISPRRPQGDFSFTGHLAGSQASFLGWSLLSSSFVSAAGSSASDPRGGGDSRLKMQQM
jgi:hypothetical protein